jgi:hypothetical protein
LTGLHQPAFVVVIRWRLNCVVVAVLSRGLCALIANDILHRRILVRIARISGGTVLE